MKTLIVDDDATCRVLLVELLKGYLVKPIAKNKLLAELRRLGLIHGLSSMAR